MFISISLKNENIYCENSRIRIILAYLLKTIVIELK